MYPKINFQNYQWLNISQEWMALFQVIVEAYAATASAFVAKPTALPRVSARPSLRGAPVAMAASSSVPSGHALTP